MDVGDPSWRWSRLEELGGRRWVDEEAGVVGQWEVNRWMWAAGGVERNLTVLVMKRSSFIN